MGLSAEIRQQLINSFKTEQGEHIQKINQGLLVLEKNPSAAEQQSLLKEIFREAHSLKGAARAVGLSLVESLGHALEETLLAAKEGRLAFSADLFDLLYQTLDALELVIKRIEEGDSTPPAKILALLARLEEVGREGKEAEEQRSRGAGEQESPPSNLPTSQPSDLPSVAILQPSTPSPSSPTDETIRVSVGKLDTLMGQFGELLGAKIRAEQRLAEVRQLQIFAAEWGKEWLALRGSYNRLVRSRPKNDRRLRITDRPNNPIPRSQRTTDNRQWTTDYEQRTLDYEQRTTDNEQLTKDVASLLDFVSKNQEQWRAFNAQTNTLFRQLSNDTLRLSLIIDELQEEIKRVRMLPLSTVTTTFGRMVRDLAREQNKQIKLAIVGADTELDKRVLEQIKDPLIHLLRNAIDHGMETPEIRQQAGKPAEGRIILQAGQQGNNVVIRVSDDGAGLDLEAIRLAAVRRGLLSRNEAENLSDGETANLIFSSGLSTSKIITDLSGRGVGMDVVRQNVEELHGMLEVNFEREQGTTFTLTLPLTLASSRGLLIRSSGQTFALPLSTVERMLRLNRSEIARVEGKEAITYQNKPIALVRLGDLLELPASAGNSEQVTIVLIAVAEKRLGLIVDDLAGEQEVVMKNLGRQLSRVGGIAGATVLGSGQVILVLHAADLIKLAGRTHSHSPAVGLAKKQEPAQRKTILVVDDSITTRTLEKNILEAAGYRVKLATDGEEALAALMTESLPDLVISDVNMPRLDGFDLTHRIKHDGRYGDIPVILVTSLDSTADKARGIKVGADAYIVKSRFDQGNLLETIEQLV